MKPPHNAGQADTRAHRLMVRAIFLMLAVLLHSEAFRHFSPKYKETRANTSAPLVVQLKPAPAPPLPPSAASPAPETSEAAPPLPRQEPSLPDAAKAATPSRLHRPAYHPSDTLTRPPELVENAPEEIELPESQGTGHVLLRLAIDRHGVVNAVNVLRSTLPRELEGQVVLQFYRARYRPGEIDGVRVNSELLLTVDLR
jgi:outer membrane biosynthesis protein TonB